jgi:D-glycero-D-manno-heptose 1,7-bisphosphate phosphatase
MKRAVFLDRDGVLDELILNPDTGEFEPPHRPEEVRLCPHTTPSLRELQSAGYELFLVSNQPDYAKGKVSLDMLRKTHERFISLVASDGIVFRDIYYCYHHPEGIVKEYSYVCECRKPKPFFLLKASEEYSLDMAKSWMVGDRDVDVQCGQAAGVRTILIDEPKSADRRGNSSPDFIVKDISEATKIILNQSK